jgi:hypothetical protein
MNYSPWFNCRRHKPVRAGEYEVRLWDCGKYGDVIRMKFSAGKWHPSFDYHSQIDVPGYDQKDQWRGVLK